MVPINTAPATVAGPAPPTSPAARRQPAAARRQWGRDRRVQAMPVVPQPVSDRRIALGRLAIIVTVAAWLGYFVTWLLEDFFDPRYAGAVDRAESVIYLLTVTILTASALAYLLSRLGFCYRTRNCHWASRAILDQFFDAKTPPLTTIVPSYQEETRVIRNTLLSAALQEYPDKRIVLLIDDPFVPRTARARELLTAARALPGQIEELLAEPAAHFADALEKFEAGSRRDEDPGIRTMTGLAGDYDTAATWLEHLAAAGEIIDHSDVFFANEVVLRLAESLRTISAALRASAAEEVVLGRSQIRCLYRRLVWTFRAEVTCFERKRYVSLSHEPNKAMNLNSYIGLMGGSYCEMPTATGLALVRSSPPACDLIVPSADYVVTLDADSVLLPEYCLRLVHLLEQSEHRDMAIAQTPYSAFPGSATRLERIAGATTDLQHIVHQGLTHFDATFWVGANAVIRKRALDDIAETSYTGNWEIRRYIKDRTVIEDTESTIDMGIHGWRLFNYPGRLSYSATPPDFGSLCIQRRRWANGGLLILPKLRRQSRARRARGERTRVGEIFLRGNYMASICCCSASLLVLLAFPFNATLISPLLGLVTVPYFLAMASDLRYCGYKRLDVARIYALNLILLPVNLAGAISSLIQGITASKAAFARTPKVRDRTVAPPFFIFAPYLLIALAGVTFYVAYRHHRVESMAYAAINVILAVYATVAFIGLRNSVADGWIHLTSLLRKPARPHQRLARKNQADQQAPQPANWRYVLEVGLADAGAWSVPAGLRNPAERHPAGPGGSGPGGSGPGGSGPGGSGPGGSAPDAPEDPDLPRDEPSRSLSPLRTLLAVGLVAGISYGGFLGVQTRLSDTTGTGTTWFAPYVDVTLPPTYQFQSASADPARQTVLGFVVSDPSSPCTPSWGAADTLGQANQSLSLGSRIAQLQQDGGQAIVSFGGESHTSLDVGCASVTALTRAYESVIDEYHLTTIDLDIEGAALNDFQAQQRRAAAVAALERAARSGHRKLSVWLTLPVEPSGLQDNAVSVIQSMLHDRVSITGVNIMTMDFTQPPAPGTTMLQDVQNALTATHAQLASLLPRYGLDLRSQQIWQRLGATVMIGQNDIGGELFTVADGRGLAGFALRNHLGRISMWSLNRDSECGSLIPEIGLMSNTCSGAAQSELEFSHVFGTLKGQATATSKGSGGDVLPPAANTNPADAPYPVWSPTAGYPLGYKVVEEGEIFQAKWYTTGQDPAQAQYGWQTPWELLGPVLPGDRAPVLSRLPAGTYPAWSLTARYHAGSTVLYRGLPYQAGWINQGVSPAGQPSDPSGSPWKPLFTIAGEPAE